MSSAKKPCLCRDGGGAGEWAHCRPCGHTRPRRNDLATAGGWLPAAQRYATDGHGASAELVWPEGGQYVLSRGKEETYTIESLNANLRTYLKRLARRCRCFSRSLLALQRAIQLFV